MKEKRNVSQMITKNTSKLLLKHATQSTDYCYLFFGEPKKSTQITPENIEHCLKKLER